MTLRNTINVESIKHLTFLQKGSSLLQRLEAQLLERKNGKKQSVVSSKRHGPNPNRNVMKLNIPTSSSSTALSSQYKHSTIICSHNPKHHITITITLFIFIRLTLIISSAQHTSCGALSETAKSLSKESVIRDSAQGYGFVVTVRVGNGWG